MSRAIPVLCYHRVAAGETLDPEAFERHLRVLARCGLPSLTPAELDTAPRGFLLTFDDGFADLWTGTLDLLERHRLRATVFAIPSRAGEGPPRPRGGLSGGARAAAVLGEASRRPGPHDGFLRWSELEALEASGLVGVQSHTWSHPAGWTGAEITGFHLGLPAAGHWSLAEATGGDERLGIPLHRRGSAIGHRLYRDDPSLCDRLAVWLERRGGAAYVRERGATAVVRELRAQVARHEGARGAWEPEEQRRARTLEEIGRARAALEARLGGRRDELCLPWGEYDEETLACAREAGIRRVYTLRRRPNPAGRIGLLVHRFEPRPAGGAWLRRRLWVYRSTWRAALYGRLSGRA